MVCVVEDHSLASAQAEHCFAHLRQRRHLAHTDVEFACQFRVTHGANRLALRQPETHREHQVSLRIPLERRGAVAKVALLGCQPLLGVAAPVPHQYTRDGLGDLLPVGTHVLDGGGASEPGDPRQRLHPTTAFVDHRLHKLVPRLPRRHSYLVAISVNATGSDQQRSPRPTVIGDHKIAAPRDQQQGHLIGVGRQRLRDEHLLGVADHDVSAGATQAQGGEVSQADSVCVRCVDVFLRCAVKVATHVRLRRHAAQGVGDLLGLVDLLRIGDLLGVGRLWHDWVPTVAGHQLVPTGRRTSASA